jgi:iron complex outermembrane receptor protein
LLSGKLQARLSDDVNMTAIGGYTDYANEFTQQSDQSPLGVTISHFQNEDQQWTGELRFDGSLLDDRLQWVVGAFALRMEGYQNNMLSFQNVFQLSKVKGINNSKSGFFHLDYNLTDPWRVSGGARYTDSEILITIDNPNAISVLDPARSPQKRWDWLISTDYKITEDVMVYASAASGSRPPGLATIVVTQRQLLPTSAEDLINYEAGIKADLFDRRFRTNLTAFYMDYRKLANSVRGFECRNQPGPVATWFPVASACSDPANGFPQPPDQVTFWNNSAIPAEVKGFEWEITAIPIDGLRIDWIGGYNKFTSGIKTPGEPGYYWPGNLRQPEWNMHANISYDLETDAGTFTPRLDWNWQSRQTWDRAPQLGPPQSDLVIDPYGLWNAQIAYTSLEGDWSAVFQVTNLADKWYHYEVLKTTFNQQTRVGAPREWKLTLRKDF